MQKGKNEKCTLFGFDEEEDVLAKEVSRVEATYAAREKEQNITISNLKGLNVHV